MGETAEGRAGRRSQPVLAVWRPVWRGGLSPRTGSSRDDILCVLIFGALLSLYAAVELQMPQNVHMWGRRQTTVACVGKNLTECRPLWRSHLSAPGGLRRADLPEGAAAGPQRVEEVQPEPHAAGLLNRLQLSHNQLSTGHNMAFQDPSVTETVWNRACRPQWTRLSAQLVNTWPRGFAGLPCWPSAPQPGPHQLQFSPRDRPSRTRPGRD
ncbi:unnamed protein product [Arctogadus glacialis]